MDSAQLTARLRNSVNVYEDKQKLFLATRYFVAQRPASPDFSSTIEGYYKGKKVIPGPKANPLVSAVLEERDIRLLEARYFIRFIDNATTDGADDSIRQALFTIMDNDEADQYEATLAKIKGINLNERSERIPGKKPQ